MDISSVDELRKKLTGISDFCYQHPGLSGPLIIGWLGLTFKDAIKTVWTIGMGGRSIWARVNKPRSARKIWDATRAVLSEKGFEINNARAALAILILVVLVGGSVVTARTIGKLGRPRPTFVDLDERVLSTNYTVHWHYSDPEHAQGITYRLRVFNDKHHPLWTSKEIPLSRAHLDWRGKGLLQVDVLENGALLTSSELRPIEIYDDSLARARATGELRIAVHVDDTQGGWCHTKEGQIAGFDPDLARELTRFVSKKVKRTVTPVITDEEWPLLLELPKDDAVDMAIASISINEQRKKDYDALFSVPYFSTSLGYVTGRADREVAHGEALVKELCGKKIGVHNGTTAETFAAGVRAECGGQIGIQVFPDNSNLVDALAAKSIEGFIYDYARASVLCDEHHDLVAVRFAATELKRLNQPAEDYGVIFSRRNWQLADTVSAAINEIKSEDTLAVSYQSVDPSLRGEPAPQSPKRKPRTGP